MKELAVPVTVTCRVLKLARQPYYRWLDRPVTDAEFERAARAKATSHSGNRSSCGCGPDQIGTGRQPIC